MNHAFSPEQREGVYQAIFQRRDIRHFRPDPIPADVLARLLQAAHHAPSVGFMQPWDFIVITSQETKEAIAAIVEKEKMAFGLMLEGSRKNLYPKLKVEGILEAPVTICFTVDPSRDGPVVLGRNSITNTDVYSTVCAIQNLWLAARAEGIGAGWVSFYQERMLQHVLGLPPHIIPAGLVSLGYVDEFPEGPLLEKAGWKKRTPISKLLHADRWGNQESPYHQAVLAALEEL